MAVEVVDHLEVVDVQEDRPDRHLQPRGLFEHRGCLLRHRAAVEEAGEGIGLGQHLQAAVGAPPRPFEHELAPQFAAQHREPCEHAVDLRPAGRSCGRLLQPPDREGEDFLAHGDEGPEQPFAEGEAEPEQRQHHGGRDGGGGQGRHDGRLADLLDPVHGERPKPFLQGGGGG